MPELPRVAILGAGPTGLEAALATAEQGWPFTIYEAGDRPAAHVRAWGHVRLFTPWDLDVSPRMARHLEAAGVPVPTGDGCPTGDELCDQVLDPVAALTEIEPNTRLGARVTSVGRRGLLKHEEISTPERGARPFRLLVAGPNGDEEIAEADIVLDCTGTYGHPNSLGDAGIPAVGESRLGSRIRRTIPDLSAEAADWAGRTVLVVGAGHSAQTAVRDLAALAALAALADRNALTAIVWAVRSAEPAWGEVADDPLPERAALVDRTRSLTGGGESPVRLETGVVVEAVAERGEQVAVTLRNGSTSEVVVDKVLALTGAVGDNSIYRQLQVHECYATAAPINLSAALLGAAGGDCLQQESHGVDVLRNPEPNFFILGSKSYGRVNQFLLRIGAEQVDEVFAALSPGA